MKILIDTHTHTTHSGHAYSTVTENLKYASENGMDLICLTDHAFNMPGGPHKFYFYNLGVLPTELYGVKLLKGVELNIMDTEGNLDDFSGDYKQVYDNFEFRIASLHPPCISYNETDDFTKTIISAMSKNNIDCLGHLGDPRFPFDIDEVVKVAKETNTLIEVNNSSLNPHSMRLDLEFVKKVVESCNKYNAYMTFGSDAHFFTEVGGFENIYKLFENYNIPYDNVITQDTNKFLDFLKENRG